MNNSTDYHDYVFKDGKLVGKFEEMYQKVEDPWHHGEAIEIHYDMMLTLLNHHKIGKYAAGTVLDIGCGKGAFTARLKKSLNNDINVIGIDIAPTAIRKAKEKYSDLGINFIVCDIKKEYKQLPIPSSGIDLIIISDLMWYVLPVFGDICQEIKNYLKDEGHLMVNQTFYPSEEQKYGKEIVSCVEDMLKLIPLCLSEMVEINRLQNLHAICLFKKG